MMPLNSLKKILCLLSILATMPAFALEKSISMPPFIEQSAIPTIEKGIGNKYYMGLGWHDGSKLLGFFLPQVQKGDTWTWWIDTGGLLYGAGTGFRQLLNVHWLNQDWFWGMYGYYESPSYNTFPIPDSDRANFGFEIAASGLGYAIFNLYGNPFFDKETYFKEDYTIEDIWGFSIKLSFDYFNRLNPFIGISANQVADNRKTGGIRAIKSFTAGLHYQFSETTDFELKFNFIDPFQSLVHAGLRIYWTKENATAGYFNNRFYRAPDRFIPHYQNAELLQIIPNSGVTLHST